MGIKVILMCLYKQIVLVPTSVLSASEEWNGSKRVDLRFWETDTFPTKYGVILSLSQWKVLCSATQVVDDLISREKDGEPVNWRYHLGEDVYVIIKAPQLTNHIRKLFEHNGEWTLHPNEERSDPESLRIERTEKDHTFI